MEYGCLFPSAGITWCRLKHLNHRSFVCSQFWSLEVQDQGGGRVGFLWGPEGKCLWPVPLLGLQRAPPTASSLGGASVHACPWPLGSLLLLIRTPACSLAPPARQGLVLTLWSPDRQVGIHTEVSGLRFQQRTLETTNEPIRVCLSSLRYFLVDSAEEYI